VVVGSAPGNRTSICATCDHSIWRIWLLLKVFMKTILLMCIIKIDPKSSKLVTENCPSVYKIVMVAAVCWKKHCINFDEHKFIKKQYAAYVSRCLRMSKMSNDILSFDILSFNILSFYSSGFDAQPPHPFFTSC
jgi:hypothetical protein